MRAYDLRREHAATIDGYAAELLILIDCWRDGSDDDDIAEIEQLARAMLKTAEDWRDNEG